MGWKYVEKMKMSLSKMHFLKIPPVNKTHYVQNSSELLRKSAVARLKNYVFTKQLQWSRF